MVIPRLVWPPGSVGLFTFPPSNCRVMANAVAKFAMRLSFFHWLNDGMILGTCEVKVCRDFKTFLHVRCAAARRSLPEDATTGWVGSSDLHERWDCGIGFGPGGDAAG